MIIIRIFLFADWYHEEAQRQNKSRIFLVGGGNCY